MVDILIGLLVASILGLVVSFAYLFHTKKNIAENNIALSLILMAPIITIIMTFIGSNLALSLGMVGSLSIIRFRSAIKDSRDLIYLLWIMAIGIGCGVKNYEAAGVATLFVLGLVFLLRFKKMKSPTLTGSLILRDPGQDLLQKLEGQTPHQIVSTPESTEYIYHLGVPEFELLRSNLGTKGWHFVASKEL